MLNASFIARPGGTPAIIATFLLPSCGDYNGLGKLLVGLPKLKYMELGVYARK